MMNNAVQTLDGNWKLAVDPDNRGRAAGWCAAVRPEAVDAPVPGVIQQVYPGYHGAAWYWHTFQAAGWTADAAERQRCRLCFGAVDYLAEVWVNGLPAGVYEGGETPFEFDITGLLKPAGENLLAVRVLNPRSDQAIDGYLLEQTPHRNKTMPARAGSAFNSGGIMYPVELRFVPRVYIRDVWVRPDPGSGAVAVTAALENTCPGAPRAVHCAVSIQPAAGGETLASAAQEVQLPPGSAEVDLAVAVAQPHLWSLDDPYLYRVTVTVTGADLAAEQRAHQVSARCGFRDFRLAGGYFHLNGQRIFVKSTHTGNCMPVGQQVAVLPDHVRRDLIFAKASGFNMVRFISGVAYPAQLDFCDEIGLMVYEECFAAWGMADSPRFGQRFDHNTAEMVRRDRNHPSVTIWGLLNETPDGPAFRQARGFLPRLRQIDPTRLVLLSSGRWDGQWATGSASNPGGLEWEPVWGVEGPDAAPVSGQHTAGYLQHSGDAHTYPPVPHSRQTADFLRGLGAEGKPVFLSEYGIGSQMDVVREARRFEQIGARPDLEDGAWLREQSEAFCADWRRLGFDGVYPFPEDMLRESQRLHARQRTLGFDLVRSNPNLCGFNLTGMLDHAITGEGLWTYWREWKPAVFDAVADGWSPLRWCLFVDPPHGYAGRAVTVEAVLATEEVLKPGTYPACFRILGPAGLAWEKRISFEVPAPAPLAVPVLRETFRLDGPAGAYVFAASLERGGAPSGGRLAFHLSDPAALPRLSGSARLWGIAPAAGEWLRGRGLDCQDFSHTAPVRPGAILVGRPANAEIAPEMWAALSRQLEGGAAVVFLQAGLFAGGGAGMDWLPMPNKGRCYTFNDWLYHKACVANRHPVFAGLPGPGIMDFDVYGPVIPHEVFEGLDTPAETLAAAFATGYYAYPRAYGSSLLMAAYRAGRGRFILNTPYLLENLAEHPAADRLLTNLIQYAQSQE